MLQNEIWHNPKAPGTDTLGHRLKVFIHCKWKGCQNDHRFVLCNLYPGFCLIINETQIIIIWFLLHLSLLNVVVHMLPRWVWPPFLSGTVNIEPPYRNISRVALDYPEPLLLFVKVYKILFSRWWHIRHYLIRLRHSRFQTNQLSMQTIRESDKFKSGIGFKSENEEPFQIKLNREFRVF